MKKLLIVLLPLVFLAVSCTNSREENLFNTNVYGNPISWKKYPIPFSFHQDFPENKKREVLEEISSLNQILGFEAISIANETSSSVVLRDGSNTLYWGFNETFRMTPTEQGKTVVVWIGSDIIEVDVNFNPAFTEVDFKSLVRHEICHVLGIKHSDTISLMSPYLPDYEIRPWDESLLTQWKERL